MNDLEIPACLSVKIADTELKYATLGSVAEELANAESEISEQQKCFLHYAKAETDLITKQYEGGLKVWEGAIDLCEHIERTNLEFSQKKVVEIGCGAGLPGILALLRGAEIVYFLDFNEFVLSELTRRNVLLNGPQLLDRCRFIGGNWNDALSDISGASFDVVLSSETIYCPESYASLHNLLSQSVAPGGDVFIASKSYYFGVGGSIAQWRSFVDSKSQFQTDEVWSSDSGVKRKILRHRKVNS